MDDTDTKKRNVFSPTLFAALFAVVAFVSQALSANPITDLENEINNAVHARDAATSQLNTAVANLHTVENELASAQSTLAGYQNQLSSVGNQLNSAKGALSNIASQYQQAQQAVTSWTQKVQSYQGAVNQLTAARQNLDNEVSALTADYHTALNNALNTKILAYSLTTQGEMTFNFETGSFYGKIDLGSGLTLDNEKIQDWMSGVFAIPDINPVQFMVSSATGLQLSHQTNYTNARAQYFASHAGGQNFFSSERFTDWASAETAAHQIALAIITDGSSTDQTIKEVQDQVLLEFNDLYSWLLQTGETDIENAATCALSAMLGEPCPSSSAIQITAQAEGVSCTYSASSSWETNLPTELFPNLKIASPSATFPSSHLAFGLSIDGANVGATQYQDAMNAFDHLTDVSGDVQALFTKAVAHLLAGGSAKAAQYFTNMDIGTMSSRLVSQAVSSGLFNQLGISSQVLATQFQQGNPIIDLTNTQVAVNLANLLRPLAQGNERSAKVDKLEIDLSLDDPKCIGKIDSPTQLGNVGRGRRCYQSMVRFPAYE